MSAAGALAPSVDFIVKGDDRGSLVAVEAERDVPFPIARVYFVYATREGVVRGCHAHRKLRQVAVAVIGRCTMTFDDGKRREDVVLDDPVKGVIIEPMIWHEMRDFAPGTVLLVIADDRYDESDYIRSYEEFRRMTGGLRDPQ